jgi:hypothetical protein
MRTVALATLLLLAVGCGGGGNHGPSCPSSHGIVLLSWTIRGQATTTQTCSAIDHLTLSMNTGCGQLSIDPIPCIQGAHWEYDNLPEGNAGVILDAVDARGAVRAEGFGSTQLTTQKPSAPTPIDLN